MNISKFYIPNRSHYGLNLMLPSSNDYDKQDKNNIVINNYHILLDSNTTTPQADETFLNSGIIGFAKELGNSLTTQADENSDDTINYSEVSGTVVSWLMRQLTDGHFDITLLKPEENSSKAFSGFGVGIHPVSLLDFKMFISESKEHNNFSFEVGVHPDQNTQFKLMLHQFEDSSKTGIEFNLNF